MSARLIGELAEWLQSPIAAGLTPGEIAILYTIAERAEDHGRTMLRHRTDDKSLIERISRGSGLKIETDALKKAFQRLAKRGLEVRVQTGTDAAGRPIYACDGRSMGFRLPVLPASVRIPERGEYVPSSEAKRGELVPPSWPLAPVDNPVIHSPLQVAEGRFSSPLSPQRGEPVPQRGEPVPAWGEPVPPLSPSVPSSPSQSKAPSKSDDNLRYPLAELEGGSGDDPPLPEIDQDHYLAAQGTLLNLPDGGTFLLARATAELPDARHEERIIHAAALAARIPA
jgi:hypothetical protein